MASGPPACERCRGGVGRDYYVIRSHVVCAACRDSIDASIHVSRSVLVRAALVGVAGAVLGGGLSYAVGVRRGGAAGYPVGLIAIVVGYLVARAVQFGSRGRRGLSLQIVAMAFSYLALSFGYLPLAADRPPILASGLPIDVIRAIALPIMVSVAHVPTSLVNVVIIVVALLPGWILLRPPHRRAVEGPFRIGASLGAGNDDGAFGLRLPPPSA